jgi:hypothetical protein
LLPIIIVVLIEIGLAVGLSYHGTLVLVGPGDVVVGATVLGTVAV